MPSTLFAQLHDMSFKSPKGFANAYIAHRMVLRRAKRFTMDAELGQQVEELAETAGERLKEWMQLARLPYADVWIERDAPTGKIGILASRHPTLPTRWKASVFIGAEYDPYLDDWGPTPGALSRRGFTVVATPLAVVVDTEAGPEDDIVDEGFALPLQDEYPNLIPGRLELFLWHLSERFPDGLPRRKPRKGIGAPWFAGNVYLSVDPVGKPMMDQVVAMLADRPEELPSFIEVFAPQVHQA